MYIVRWLMGHPIIAVWALGALAIFMTLGNGEKHESVEHEVAVSEHSEGESDSNLSHKSSVESNVMVSERSDESVVHVDDEENNDSTKKDAEGSKVTETSISNTDANNNAQTLIEAVEVSSDAGSDEPLHSDAEETKVTVSESAVSEEQTTQVSVEPEKDSAAASVEETTAVSDLKAASTEELLRMAREAYWNNGLEEAALLYKQLITLEPKTIEHKGELGNVYWKQGYPEKAAELYLEIAEPMIKSGKSDKVENMIGFINLFYPEKADNLSKLIQPK